MPFLLSSFSLRVKMTASAAILIPVCPLIYDVAVLSMKPIFLETALGHLETSMCAKIIVESS